nr:GNAT family N-acetyltransferase [Micromonospora sp. DSM 115978]
FSTDVPSVAELDARWLPAYRWVAAVDGKIAGWASAAAVSDRACYAGVAERSIYVGPAYQGRGVGSALLRQLVRAADQGGLWTLQATVFPSNRASVALHHAAGFRTVGVRERIGQDRDGVWRDTVLLERRSAAAGR